MTGVEEVAIGYGLVELAQAAMWAASSVLAAIAGAAAGDAVSEQAKKAKEAEQKARELEAAAKGQPPAKPHPCQACGERSGGSDDGGNNNEEDPQGDQQKVPDKAKDTYDKVMENDGQAPDGYEGGREFKNREGRLPDGNYREYDVDPKVPGQPRNAERIVIEQGTGKGYYTPDHYTTFIPF